MNFASIMLQPQSDFAMVLTTNVGGAAADQGLQRVAERLYKGFGPSAD